MGLRAGPCQMKAYRNLVRKFKRTGLWTDEAHLSLKGGVNSQNCRIWSTENLNEIIQEGLHDKKVTVWSSNTRYDRNHIQPFVRSGRIGSGYWGWMSCAGPGELVRINPQFTSAEYVDMLESLMLPTVRAIYSDNNIDFVHDKVPVVRWPTKSPDLNFIKHLWAAVVRNWENEDNIRTVYALHQSVMSVWE
ncbi:hypothetical protein ILUMI_23166 [Ignelater luminosus]|uniref:Uncharacterized protein n=1 Tax=Ignelater luminosus TaxID=2038154 RepID=A0A8K0C9C1_IGNLU|nr:hypothetical protein ILUMI_23166 [Ignelater luminosus]